jgi:nicotinamidase-related amidase
VAYPEKNNVTKMSNNKKPAKKNNTALLIIDVQNGVFGKPNETYRAEPLLDNLEDLIKRARKASVPVIYVQHNEGEMKPNTTDWQIHQRLTPQKGEIIIQKRHPDSFQDTPLEETLLKLGVKKLVIGGLQTEWCIDSTVRRAYSLGFNVTVVEDGHSTMDSSVLDASKIVAHHNQVFGGRFARLKQGRDIDLKQV